MAGTLSPRVGRVRVLLVATDAAVRFAFADYFGGGQFTIECVGTPAEAGARLSEVRFDAVLTDLYFDDPADPVGLSLIRLVRRLDPRVVTCLLTGPAEPELREQAGRLADAVLIHPLPLADIARVVLSLLARPAETDS